jgi:lipoprotein-releasing system ATP-binding protein
VFNSAETSFHTFPNLDSKNADELQQTFVIVTHNNEFADMADRKLEISAGRVVGDLLV